ncbi:MAG: hypothetical protein ABS45_04535 [Comamonas sp. SCN 65-56]|uniref:NAD(P)-dependent alcohol dehydrogenase n=1 Tax=Comamonas sp. SCN 65-56 TaxID=1660095 RepID=UPI00086AD12E|nr:NAD(P)-dependent alcohol dehydrogenase [Comamonas sp. SCN 65-56]ODS93173.1 MAG: hypothetical protein ABS45_04535 [Comamonas sp. SCN 65-56]
MMETHAKSQDRQVMAAVVERPGMAFRLEQLVLAAPMDDEICVRVVATGICHTDVAMRDSDTRAPKPIVLGHEGAGVVESVGRLVTRIQPGDHVVMSYGWCGSCARCAAGRMAYCRDFNSLNFGGRRPDGSTGLRRLDGQRVHGHFFGQSSFATHVVTNERHAVVVPRDLPLQYLAPLGCGVQTGAGAILNSLRVQPGDSVAVFGVGSVGMSAVMAAKAAGASRIIAIDIHPARLELARELGACTALDARAADFEADLAATVGDGVTHAVDTTGRPETIKAALASLTVHGVCGLVAMPQGEIPFDPRQLMVGGRMLRGIVEGDGVPGAFIPHLVELYRAGRFPLDQLVRCYPFAQINEAMADMERGQTLKPVLLMPG